MAEEIERNSTRDHINRANQLLDGGIDPTEIQRAQAHAQIAQAQILDDILAMLITAKLEDDEKDRS